MYTLTSQTGPTKGVSWSIGESKIVIGRAPNCDVTLCDSMVSRHHCEIVATGDQVFLNDLSSSNATLVNGRPATQCVLRPGDEIAVGRAVFLVTCIDPPVKPHGTEGGDATTVTLSDGESDSMGDVTAELVAKAYPNSVQELATLFELSRHFSRAVSIPDLVSTLFDGLKSYYAPSYMWMGVLLPHSHELAFYSNQSVLTGDFAPAPAEVVRKARKALAKRDGLNVPIMAREGEAHQLATLLAAPVSLAGQQLGVVLVRCEADIRLPSDSDLRFLMAVASTMAPYFQSIRQLERLRRDNESLRAVTRSMTTLVGRSSAMRQVRALIEKAAMTSLSVLVTGETGTGKELVTHMLHEASPRAAGPLVTVNCAAIPPHLFESELFGYERGAFTGATQRKIGLIEQANGGTLFLDEVGDLSLDNQAKLLRVIESGLFFRVGATRETRVDIRVISATNKDLPHNVRRGEFREDLYHRLNGFHIAIPPLRERPEDIKALAEHFFQLNLTRAKRPITGFSDDAMDYLVSYAWPGNVRQLRNTVERAVAMAHADMIGRADLKSPADEPAPQGAGPTLRTLADVERAHIADVLRRCGGKVNEAAKVLGIGRSTLYTKISQYGLIAGDNDSSAS
ncbi:MAG: hypothetical protein AMXMBFR4_15870 [Candidatus Hydrogenedentota bacterium]